MDKNTLKIAIAAFFHDMGKFTFSGWFEESPDQVDYKRTLYQPKNTEGKYSHVHALYTALFIETYGKWLPEAFNALKWGDGEDNDCLTNLAAMHHKPESVWQSIITQADCLTSGIDRMKYQSESMRLSFRDYLKARLQPIFENIYQDEMKQEYDYQYPLACMSPHTIFPEKRVDISEAEAKDEYQRLFEQFIIELKSLKHRGNVALWFEHFESLAMFYLSAIPASRDGESTRDVSLYDHLRVTSAFAVALYQYHLDKQTLDEKSIVTKDDTKFLMISGNFFGIQSFIFKGYGDTRKYRARLLRGRSFYVSLLVELAADMLCQNAGLPLTSIVLNAGGIFTILAPNTEKVKRAISQTQKTINEWLIKMAYGELTIGFSYTPATPAEFSGDDFTKLWDRMVEEMDEIKFKKLDLQEYGGEVSTYLNQFKKKDHNVCKICGIRPERTKIYPENTPACSLCRDQIHIGTNLVKKECLSIMNVRGKGQLQQKIFDYYQLKFFDHSNIESSHILHYWDIAYPNNEQTCLKHGITRKIINAYVPIYKPDDATDARLKMSADDHELSDSINLGHPKQFQSLADLASTINDDKIKGISALGILKADVDYLAKLMACGLPPKQYTLSRIATLSRQMNNFFALYLPSLLSSEFDNIYTVFAGGDDLFLIGPYNQIYDLAKQLDQDFRRYACHHPEIHFSAGIVIQKSGVPLDILAESSETCLKQSKVDRNRLTLFEQTVEWSELEKIDRIQDKLHKWLDDGYFSKSMLYKLNTFIQMAEKEQKIMKKDTIDLADMHCLKWKSMLRYFAVRNIKIDEEKEQLTVNDLVEEMSEWLTQFPGALRIPLWLVLYGVREER